ncbi:hypothetical protein PoB_002079200 [Plakobranchus ocellatus]|uniref:Neurotransmitter-gated ion-channel transmembrane domain-containing protein n=1 Tax=Plakobranchus ocellatus TaxID=259542 RepID=A0AAV3ZIE1_9GAST|nr:hypothetical protein PoB_002079200 [Plakobranchus ocellatus]
MLYFSGRWMRPLSEGKRNNLVSRLLDGSQEKHTGHILCRSHGITVLLALTVSMGIRSGMLPRLSESMPLDQLYLYSDDLPVVDSVIIVRLHHMEEREERAQRAGENFEPALPRIKVPQNAMSPSEERVKALQKAKAKHCHHHKLWRTNEDGTRKKDESILSASSLSRGQCKKRT